MYIDDNSSYANVLESYMIAEEGIFGKFKEMKATKAKIAAKKEELSSLPPMEIAKKIVNAVINGNAYTNGLATGSEAESQINIMYRDFVNNPGKINPTISQKVTISGIPCILCTRKNKKTGNEEFQLVAVPYITKNNKVDVDVISLHFGAQMLVNMGI